MPRWNALGCLLATLIGGGCDRVFGLTQSGEVTGDALPVVDGGGPVIDVVGLGAYDSAVLADNPLSYWKLDETSGTVAQNEVATGPAGTYVGDIALGEDGTIDSQPNTSVALGPNGGPSGIDFGDNFAFEGNQAFSVEMWFRNDLAPSPDPVTLLSKQEEANEYIGWDVFTQSNAAVVRRLPPTAETGVGTVFILTDEMGWKHVVAVYDGSKLTIYVNGGAGLEGNSPAMIPSPLSPTHLLAGTNSPAGTSRALRGRIDNIAIYDHALSATRIAKHYASSAL
ncbi:hypothetical protein BH11MYX2_BH11MYX2_31860 [soil metagenome]